MNKLLRTIALVGAVLCASAFLNVADAQDVRYSWFEFGVLGQDVQKEGSQFDPGLNQSVNINALDGGGVRFRGSVGTWRNFYVFMNFESSDPDVEAVVTNSQGIFLAEDKFDLTSIRGGVGYKYSLNHRADIVAELGYDSVDFDFGSFAGEDFDVDGQDVGASVGVRWMVNDDIELRAHGRFTNVGDVNLTTQEFESDVLFGVGIGYMPIRGFSFTLDYETGQIETLSIGFRLDLDED
jgi:hypothetical protein